MMSSIRESSGKKEVRIVPWLNAEEFKEVARRLYSPDLIDKGWALDTIDVWKSKCYPNLPIAIECSSQLVSAIVRDAHFLADVEPITQIVIEMLYSAAIMRFINLTVSCYEEELSRISLPTAMHAARQLGIPTYIVDLRNQISHDTNFPPLPFMRRAAEDALDYLKKSYWDKEVTNVKDWMKEHPNLKYRDAILSFMRAQLQIIKDLNGEMVEGSSVGQRAKIRRMLSRKNSDKKAKNNEEKESSDQTQAEIICEDIWFSYGSDTDEEVTERTETPKLKKSLMLIDECIRDNKYTFLDVLVTDFFIPKDEEFKYFMDRETWELFTSEHDELQDPENKYSPPLPSCIPDLPELHQTLWLPLIRKMLRNDIIPDFLVELLMNQGSKTVMGSKLLISWVIKILMTKSCKGLNELNVVDPLVTLFKWNTYTSNWDSLFYYALKNPCRYTHLITPWIIPHLEKDMLPLIQRQMSLLAIYMCFTQDEKKDNEKKDPQLTRIFTLKDLIRARRLMTPEQRGFSDEKLEEIIEKFTAEQSPIRPFGYKIPLEKKETFEFTTVDEDSDTEEKVHSVNWFQGDFSDEPEDTSEIEKRHEENIKLVKEAIIAEMKSMKNLVYKIPEMAPDMEDDNTDTKCKDTDTESNSVKSDHSKEQVGCCQAEAGTSFSCCKLMESADTAEKDEVVLPENQ